MTSNFWYSYWLTLKAVAHVVIPLPNRDACLLSSTLMNRPVAKKTSNDTVLPGLVHSTTDAAGNGLNTAFPLVYEELYRLARGYMRREREAHTLQPTALVNEAYLRLVTQHSVDFGNRAQLLGVAAQMMRRILSTYEEKRNADKRGHEFAMVQLDDATEPAAPKVVLFSQVDEALHRLAVMDERQAKVAELRIFGGLTSEEIRTLVEAGIAETTDLVPAA